MRYREFGSTGLKVSQLGFGAWPIGGKSYGAVDEDDSLRALAVAEELGCNFVDTASVYGNSENVLGTFLQGRRDKWVVATKYSGQKQGLTATVEDQLRRLATDRVDFYQLHWVPRREEHGLFDELYRLKRDGKVRFVGVSLYSVSDIDYVLDRTAIDGFQICFSLLDPLPFLARLQRVREKKVAVVVRSCLKAGFLSGKYSTASVFTDEHDQRREWSREKILETLEAVEKYRFLEQDSGSILRAAVQYPLSFPEVSTVILGTKTAVQATENFGDVGDRVLGQDSLNQVLRLQKGMGLLKRGILRRLIEAARRIAGLY